MDFLYDNSMGCLFCIKTFKTKKPRLSRLPVRARDTDFYLRYEYVNPYVYEAVVCPHCAMAFTDKFAPLSDRSRAILQDSYIKQAQQEDFSGPRSLEQGIRSLKLALICASLISESPPVFTGLCMRIAWLNRELGNQAEELQFLKRAYDAYAYIYSEVRFDEFKISESNLLHMLAELSCRLNEPDRARKWFGSLFMLNDQDYRFLNEARDRWLDYKETLKK
ncbi:MAG: hypothetical protein FD169_1241 [Bacillota bacterium]|nr:MAG: hypothetical protein FD169_1241 [Bacillota bacterium]MBS3950212.1 DUF2225 domain-containing protein [Peptococcaceae bacterium]